jgi:hypothetical protein
MRVRAHYLMAIACESHDKLGVVTALYRNHRGSDLALPISGSWPRLPKSLLATVELGHAQEVMHPVRGNRRVEAGEQGLPKRSPAKRSTTRCRQNRI